eukprot:GHVU01102243.1.p3 GENE.GHVU01102243.1~~GHVU01102243.1.p3  ORF type:complete len:129 (-),score=18.38 GHVU01102243.1:2262-2648(-)
MCTLARLGVHERYKDFVVLGESVITWQADSAHYSAPTQLLFLMLLRLSVFLCLEKKAVNGMESAVLNKRGKLVLLNKFGRYPMSVLVAVGLTKSAIGHLEGLSSFIAGILNGTYNAVACTVVDASSTS